MANSNDLFLDMVEFKAKYAYLADQLRELKDQFNEYEDNYAVVGEFRNRILENSIAELKAIINKYDI